MNVGGRIKTLGLACALNCFLIRVAGEAAVKIYHWFCNGTVILLVLTSVVTRIMERLMKWGIVGTLMKVMERVLVRALEQILKGELFMLKTVFGEVSNQFLCNQSRYCSDSWARQDVSSA
jgi:hypothetical protein